jgi:hypothetical protein
MHLAVGPGVILALRHSAYAPIATFVAGAKTLPLLGAETCTHTPTVSAHEAASPGGEVMTRRPTDPLRPALIRGKDLT